MVLSSVFMSLSCRISYWSSQGFSTCSPMGFRSQPMWTTADLNSLDSLCCKYFNNFSLPFSLSRDFEMLTGRQSQIISSSTDFVLFVWGKRDPLFHLTLLPIKPCSLLDNHFQFNVKMFQWFPVHWRDSKLLVTTVAFGWAEKKTRGGFGVFCILELAQLWETPQPKEENHGCVVLDKGCPLKYTAQ